MTFRPFLTTLKESNLQELIPDHVPTIEYHF
jgi:hypothetical protein